MACGPGKFGDKIVPDSPLGVNLRSCCQLHDEGYASPGNRARLDVDLDMLDCMLHKVKEHEAGYVRALMVPVILRYYYAVRIFGWISWGRARRKDR